MLTHSPSTAACSSAGQRVLWPKRVLGTLLGVAHKAVGVCIVLLVLVLAASGGSKFSDQQRQQIIRAFLAEHPFLRRNLPRGQTGVIIEGNKITPSESELRQVVEHSGAVARPGERVLITAIRFRSGGILFEVNGGPKSHKSWNERVQIGMSGSAETQSSPSANSESLGSSVMLTVGNAGGLTVDRIKTMLAPVLDFQSETQAEAYQSTLPPKLSAAVQDHRALVGMDRDMVIAALGRPPQRLRESSGGQEYEEWIYGTPPQDVQFIRFVQGKVVRIEEMKITGEKLVRTENEISASVSPTNAQQSAAQDDPNAPPSLLRRGGENPSEQQAPPTLPAPVPQHDPEGN